MPVDELELCKLQSLIRLGTRRLGISRESFDSHNSTHSPGEFKGESGENSGLSAWERSC